MTEILELVILPQREPGETLEREAPAALRVLGAGATEWDTSIETCERVRAGLERL